jgi:rhodanese-related sulfurtransferase
MPWSPPCCGWPGEAMAAQRAPVLASLPGRSGMKLGRALLGALSITVCGSALGLAVNAVRPAGIPLVAPFPYQQDCPDKLEVPEGPTVTGAQAVAFARSRRALFVDARPAEAFSAGHIPQARSLPFSFIAAPGTGVVAELGKTGRPVICYCDSPGDKLAGLLAGQLREAGLGGVKVLSGGLAAFRAAGGDKR